MNDKKWTNRPIPIQELAQLNKTYQDRRETHIILQWMFWGSVLVCIVSGFITFKSGAAVTLQCIALVAATISFFLVFVLLIADGRVWKCPRCGTSWLNVPRSLTTLVNERCTVCGTQYMRAYKPELYPELKAGASIPPDTNEFIRAHNPPLRVDRELALSLGISLVGSLVVPFALQVLNIQLDRVLVIGLVGLTFGGIWFTYERLGRAWLTKFLAAHGINFFCDGKN